MSAALATPASTMRIASRPRATPSRDVANPGTSANADRLLPERRGERLGRRDAAAGVSRAVHDLDEGHHGHGVEEVDTDDSSGSFGRARDSGDR